MATLKMRRGSGVNASPHHRGDVRPSLSPRNAMVRCRHVQRSISAGGDAQLSNSPPRSAHLVLVPAVHWRPLRGHWAEAEVRQALAIVVVVSVAAALTCSLLQLGQLGPHGRKGGGRTAQSRKGVGESRVKRLSPAVERPTGRHEVMIELPAHDCHAVGVVQHLSVAYGPVFLRQQVGAEDVRRNICASECVLRRAYLRDALPPKLHTAACDGSVADGLWSLALHGQDPCDVDVVEREQQLQPGDVTILKT